MKIQYQHTAPGEFYTPMKNYPVIQTFINHWQIVDDMGITRMIAKNNVLFTLNSK